MDFKAKLIGTLSLNDWPHYGLEVHEPYLTWWNAENEMQMFGVWLPDYELETVQTAFAQLETLKAQHDANPDDVPAGMALYVLCMGETGNARNLIELANVPDLAFLVVSADGSYTIYYSDGTGGLFYNATSGMTGDAPDSEVFKAAIKLLGKGN